MNFTERSLDFTHSFSMPRLFLQIKCPLPSYRVIQCKQIKTGTTAYYAKSKYLLKVILCFLTDCSQTKWLLTSVENWAQKEINDNEKTIHRTTRSNYKKYVKKTCTVSSPLLFSFLDADPYGLACRTRSSITYHGLVADGTRCTNRPDIFDVCVVGECKVSFVLLDELKPIYISRLRMDRPVHYPFYGPNHLVSQSINQSINQSISQSRSINWYVDR